MGDNERIMRRIAQRARREHWPMPNAAALVYQGVAMALGNGLLWWLVMRRLFSPLSLVMFCVSELLLLIAIARIEAIAVPRDARFDGRHHAVLGAQQERSSILGRLFLCVFMSIWLSAVYAFGLMADPNLAALMSGARPADVLVQSHVLWPLLCSAVLASIAVIGNRRIWHRRGGVFVPEMSQPIAPKQLTIFLAPIPATMALFTYIDDDGDTALLAWCLTYLGIKCVLEIGMLGLSLFGWYILASVPPTPAQTATAVGASE